MVVKTFSEVLFNGIAPSYLTRDSVQSFDPHSPSFDNANAEPLIVKNYRQGYTFIHISASHAPPGLTSRPVVVAVEGSFQDK